MVMLNKEYMINHMRNENGSINIKNVVLASASSATPALQALVFQCQWKLQGSNL